MWFLGSPSADYLLADAATAEMAQQVVPEPDGSRLAYAATRGDRTDLWLVDGDETRELTGRGALAQRYTHLDTRWFDWHPDGVAAGRSTDSRPLRRVRCRVNFARALRLVSPTPGDNPAAPYHGFGRSSI